VCMRDSSPRIVNSIIASNSSGIYRYDATTTPVLSYNCVYGNGAYNYRGLADPTGIDGNISSDPRLVDVQYGNVHIQPDSPCVDAGSNAETYGSSTSTVSHGSSLWAERWTLGPMNRMGQYGRAGRTQSSGSAQPETTPMMALLGRLPSVRCRRDQRRVGAGGEVWVQAGTYYERITLHPYAYVYGGFAGSEAEREDRDWGANVTTLDGQQQGSVVTARAGYRISTIDGFTITNGSGTWVDSWDGTWGGGLYLYSASPTIANNTIIGNGAGGKGGGLYVDFDSSPTIVNNRIAGNRAGHRGGGCSCWAPHRRLRTTR